MNSAPTVDSSASRFPDWLVWTVWGCCSLPFLLGLCGVDLGFDQLAVPKDGQPVEIVDLVEGRPAAMHVLLEWSAFCIAAVTVVFAVVHYSIRRELTMPVIGAALCFAGLLDAFRALAILGVTATVRDPERFIPFTWALSRVYHGGILVGGILPFVLNRDAAEHSARRVNRVYTTIGIAVFVAVTYGLVAVCANTSPPIGFYRDSVVSRPWDVFPLLVYVSAMGFVLPRFHSSFPSLFAHGLIVSMVPNILSELHATFGSRSLFDHDSVAAQLLKIVAYLVPLLGLIIDYVRAHESDVSHEVTRAKLRAARDVQQGLLPESAPSLPGFEIAGRSEPTDAVGGDYFDYLVDDAGRVGIVVGDVSGHELAASIVLAQTRAYLRALATAHDEIGPMLTELNQFLHEVVRDRWFVTMFLARIDPGDRSLRYAAAGHEAFLVRGDGTIVPLRPTASPLGMMETSIEASPEEPTLAPGDVLLITSDGVNEATPPDSTDQFGIDRATRLVADLANRPATEIVEALFEAVATHRGGVPAEDDVTVVVARCVG